jgi:hypothetical protein
MRYIATIRNARQGAVVLCSNENLKEIPFFRLLPSAELYLKLSFTAN